MAVILGTIMSAPGQAIATSTDYFPHQMMNASGQIIVTSSGSFPQQMISGMGKSAIIVNQSDFTPANANQALMFGQYGIVSNQQSFFSPKAVAGSRKQKMHTFRNQQRTLQPNSFYASTMPVHSPYQGYNGNNMRNIPSHPQVITTQDSGNMMNEAQLLGSQAVGPLPPNLSWPPDFQPFQNPIIIYNPQSDMAVQQFQRQMAMQLPVDTAVMPFTTTPFASTFMDPQKPKLYPLKPKGVHVTGTSDASPSPSKLLRMAVFSQTNQAPYIPVAQQSNANNQTCPVPIQVINNKTKSDKIASKPVSVENEISASQESQTIVTPCSQNLKTFVEPTPIMTSVVSMTSSTGVSPSPSNIQTVTTFTQLNQIPSTSIAQEKSKANNQTYSNPVQIDNDKIKSTETKNESACIEMKITSPQKSPSMVTPFINILLAPTTNAASSASTITSSTMPVMAGSATQVDTSFSSVDTVTSSVSTIAPVACLVNRKVSDFNSKSLLLEPHNEAIDTSHQTVKTAEHLKSQQAIQKSSLEPNEKHQKAIVKPQILTHIINGFIIQEGREPFPVSQFPVLDLPCERLSPKKLESAEKKKDLLTVSKSENDMRTLRPRKIVELAMCEFCKKFEPKFRFKSSKRFCSKYCAKQFNKDTPKRVGRPSLAVQGHVGSGVRGRKKKRFRGRKRLQKQLLIEDENTKAIPAEEITSIPENETTISYNTEEENYVPLSDSSHQTLGEEDKSNNEVEITKTDLSKKLPSKWTAEEVFEFVQNFPSCSEYADNFKSQEVDGKAFLLLNESHLRTALGMKLGPAIKMISQVKSIEAELQSQLDGLSATQMV